MPLPHSQASLALPHWCFVATSANGNGPYRNVSSIPNINKLQPLRKVWYGYWWDVLFSRSKSMRNLLLLPGTLQLVHIEVATMAPNGFGNLVYWRHSDRNFVDAGACASGDCDHSGLLRKLRSNIPWWWTPLHLPEDCQHRSHLSIWVHRKLLVVLL